MSTPKADAMIPNSQSNQTAPPPLPAHLRRTDHPAVPPGDYGVKPAAAEHGPAAAASGHFSATCSRYPTFAFNVPGLRKIFDARGEKHRSAVVRFVSGYFDSENQGYTPQEAQLIREQLLRCTMTGVSVAFDQTGKSDPTITVKQSRAQAHGDAVRL